MPTIKTKKEMNLPELIEWATSNDITNTFAKLNSQWPLKQGIRIHNDGRLRLVEMEYLSKNNIFTVEVEEEITEDIKLDLIERFIGGMGNVCYTSHTMTIKECLKRTPEACKTTHLYIENDERELVLIWRDGKLVE